MDYNFLLLFFFLVGKTILKRPKLKQNYIKASCTKIDLLYIRVFFRNDICCNDNI